MGKRSPSIGSRGTETVAQAAVFHSALLGAPKVHIPIGAGNPKQHPWAGSPSMNDHSVSFDFDGVGTITLDPGLPAGASVETGFSAAAINALAIRARASLGDAANVLSPITISFDLGGPDVVLGALTGHSDAEYIVVTDSRFAGGFEDPLTPRDWTKPRSWCLISRTSRGARPLASESRPGGP